jgi:hypothetical protein
VASGLAALILDYWQQRIPDVRLWFSLKSYFGMQRVFRLMSQREKRNGFSIVTPFQAFARDDDTIWSEIQDALGTGEGLHART